MTTLLEILPIPEAPFELYHDITIVKKNDVKKILDLKKNEPLTTAMPNKGFRGFRALSSTSNFVSVDNDALRNPLLGIAATVVAI